MKVLLIFLIIVLSMGSNCLLSDQIDESGEKILTGKIIYVSLEGGFYKLGEYVLVSDNEEIAEKIKSLSGQTVRVKGNEKEKSMSIFMAGPLFEVKEVQLLNNK